MNAHSMPKDAMPQNARPQNAMPQNAMPKDATSRTGDVSSSEGVAADELKAFIERLERLEEEKAGIMGDIKEVFAELKGRGFDAKAVRTIVRIRKQDHGERQEQEAILELYMQALGMA